MCEKFLKSLKPKGQARPGLKSKGQARLRHPKDPNSESLWMEYTWAAHLCYNVFQHFLQLPSHSVAIIEHGQSLGPTTRLVADRGGLSICIHFSFFTHLHAWKERKRSCFTLKRGRVVGEQKKIERHINHAFSFSLSKIPHCLPLQLSPLLTLNQTDLNNMRTKKKNAPPYTSQEGPGKTCTSVCTKQQLVLFV